MVITYERETDIILENITVDRQLFDGEHKAYRLTANDGYVMYDTERNVYTEIDPETGEEITVIDYCRFAVIPKGIPVENWRFVAVLESTVPPDHIFGIKPPVVDM